MVSILPESHANGVLEPGDVILGLDGKPVRIIPDLTNPLASLKPGDTVRLLVERGQQQTEAQVKLLPRPSQEPRRGSASALIQPGSMPACLSRQRSLRKRSSAGHPQG